VDLEDFPKVPEQGSFRLPFPNQGKWVFQDWKGVPNQFQLFQRPRFTWYLYWKVSKLIGRREI